MSVFLRTIIPAILMLACSSSWSIQLKVPLIESKPTIDGTVSAAEQASASSIDLTRVGGLDRPVYPTKVYVAATLTGLYVGFVAHESHMKNLITSATEENGAVFNDDSVQILLTPTLETAADAYYHFALNPKGVKYSNYLSTGEIVNGYETAVGNSPSGWEAEFFIPLQVINAPAELPYWRVNFARVRPSRGSEADETSAWVNPGISLHNYKRFGYMTMPRFVPAAPGAEPPYTTSTVEVISTATMASK